MATARYEVDDYGEGATGDDDYDDDDGDDGDGTERRNNQIEATAAVGGNNSHRRSTAESDDDEDDDNRSRQNCATGMRALRRGTSTIPTTPMRRRLQAGLRQRRRHQHTRDGGRRDEDGIGGAKFVVRGRRQGGRFRGRPPHPDHETTTLAAMAAAPPSALSPPLAPSSILAPQPRTTTTTKRCDGPCGLTKDESGYSITMW